MARTGLTRQVITTDGLNPTYAAANTTDGNSFERAAADEFLHVKNAGGAPMNVTLGVNFDPDGNITPDKVVAVPAGDDVFIGPFSAIYEQTDHDVYVDFSAAATVALLVVE